MIELVLNQQDEENSHVIIFDNDECCMGTEGAIFELTAESKDRYDCIKLNPYGYEFTLEEAKQLHEFLGKVIAEAEGM